MKLARLSVGPAFLLALLAGCATTPRDPGPPGPLVEELSGKAAPQRRSAPESELAYARAVDSLLPGMSAENLLEREGPQAAFEQICFRAGRPGAENDRAALCKTICERLGPQTAKPARVWMLRQMERVSGAESVPTLTTLLKDEDAVVRDLSRRALQNNPSADAAAALRTALEQADAPEWRVALINALGARGDAASVPLLAAQTPSANEVVAVAAAVALGDIGGPDALAALKHLRGSGPPALRNAVADAYVRCADRLLARGQREQAVALFQELYDSSDESKAARIAALRGLGLARGADAVPLLMNVILGDDVPLRRVAAAVLNEISGESVTNELARKLMPVGAGPKLPLETQVLLLDTLAARGDPAGRLAALFLTESDDEAVRTAALRALGALGDETCVLPLAKAAGRTGGTEADAARISLGRLRGAPVDATLLSLLQNSGGPAARTGAADDFLQVPTRVELIHALAMRQTKGAVPVLFQEAAHADEDVRVAALEALGAIGGENDAAALARQLAAARSPKEQKAAEEAVAAVCLLNADMEKRAEPVLNLLKAGDAPPAAKVSAVRVLSRLNGKSALAAIRALRADADPSVQDAAIRALASWPDAAPLDDVLQIARSESDPARKTLALRGYIRMTGLPSDREPAATLGMYKTALELVGRPDEKKLVLSGLAQVGHADALELAKSFLNESAVKDEAATAVLTLARSLCGANREASAAALEQVRASSPSESVNKKLEEFLKQMERFEGYSTVWRVAGPYMQDGKNLSQLFDIAFPPEQSVAEPAAADPAKPDAAASNPNLQWKPLRIADPNNPWIFDLAKAVGGNDRCAYVRTRIWSEKAQPARLEIGSDDGVKVWLNGQLAYGKNVTRALTPADDKVEVALVQGWNTLLLKVIQGNGDWRFCCGVRAPDGGKLEGVTFKAE